MMQIMLNPRREDWPSILARPVFDHTSLEKSVDKILRQVRKNGDAALRKYTAAFDQVRLRTFEVSAKEKKRAIATLDPALKEAILQAASNIRRFHELQKQGGEELETMEGVFCSRKAVPIESVGLYIPGGSAPLFSTILMLGIPAVIAGCRSIILCTPPAADGSIHPAIIFAAETVGVPRIFKVGGVQAIGAMAYGTGTIPQVHKIFGPGNQYVTMAKQLVQQHGTAIDMPAGPSEVCVLADASAEPAYIAADLLSQAEHGADSQVLLVTTSESLVHEVLNKIEAQLAGLPRRELAAQALGNSKAIVLDSINDAMDLVNAYAAEHLIISCSNHEALAEKVVNAGSVFLGNFSPESVGDYASGTNHTLPTNGYARAYSGVSVDSFVKKITFQQLTRKGLEKIANTVITMAEHEGLKAHAEAVRVRLS